VPEPIERDDDRAAFLGSVTGSLAARGGQEVTANPERSRRLPPCRTGTEAPWKRLRSSTRTPCTTATEITNALTVGGILAAAHHLAGRP
jgi:hypothetical protein